MTLKVIKSDTDFLLVIHINHGHISYRNDTRRAFLVENRQLSLSPFFNAANDGIPSEF